MRTCPSCGQQNPEGNRFCGACGASIRPAARDLRKTVTVVFSDLSGFTDLGEQLDPESLRRVQVRFFEAARAALERHGATVEKFIGDAVMAVFGIPVVHEDDALRAVRAAIDLRDAVVAHGLTAEVGIETGEVLAGDASAGEAFATGEAVITAQRLEAASPPGEILIGSATYQLVRDAVRVEPLGALALKGKADGVVAYRILGLTDGVRVARLASPLVGRQRQLALLRGAFESAAGQRAAHLFTLVGPPGIGKTRVLDEFLSSLEGGARILRGRCLSYGDGITFSPLVDALRGAGVLDRLADELAGEEDGDQVAARATAALGIAGADAPVDEGLWAIRRLLEVLARDRPLVVAVEDLHWAEPRLLELVEYVLEWSREAPILLVCTARPELLETRPDWGGGKLNAATAGLEPLAEDEAGALAVNLLGGSELPAAAHARVLAAAEGNPLFVEELLGMLADEGVLTREDGRWRLLAEPESIPVPATIQAVLAARLDRLSDAERAVLEAAAVEGKVFQTAALPDGVEEVLVSLARKDLIRPERSETFRFRHVLIRDAAYDAIPKERRAELHMRFADWLESTSADGLGEREEFLGYHLESASRLREELGLALPELAARAARHLGAAGRRATDRWDFSAAVSLLGRAEALARNERERLELLPALSRSLRWTGDVARAEVVAAEAIELARKLGEPRLLGRALAERTDLLSALSQVDYGWQLAELREALRLLEQASDESGAAQVSWMIAELLRGQGRVREARDAVEAALSHARAAGDDAQEGRARTILGRVLYFGLSPWSEVERETLETLDWTREHGPRFAEETLQVRLAVARAETGRFTEARAGYERAHQLFGESGNTVGRGGHAPEIASVEQVAGNAEAAVRILSEAADELAALGDRGYLSTVLAALAGALVDTGDTEEALAASEQSESLTSPGDAFNEILWRAARARALARLGDMVAAERLGREAHELAKATELYRERTIACEALAEVLRLAGRDDDALPLLEGALALHEAKGSLVSTARVRAQLAELRPAAPA